MKKPFKAALAALLLALAFAPSAFAQHAAGVEEELEGLKAQNEETRRCLDNLELDNEAIFSIVVAIGNL